MRFNPVAANPRIEILVAKVIRYGLSNMEAIRAKPKRAARIDTLSFFSVIMRGSFQKDPQV